MTIGELAVKTGVPASTIRYWERIGVLRRAPRISGQRRYAADAIHELALLRLAQACGFRLDEMSRLVHGFRSDVPASRRWQDLAMRKRQELDDQIGKLKAMRHLVDLVLQCKCGQLSDCGRIAASVMEFAAE